MSKPIDGALSSSAKVNMWVDWEITKPETELVSVKVKVIVSSS